MYSNFCIHATMVLHVCSWCRGVSWGCHLFRMRRPSNPRHSLGVQGLRQPRLVQLLLPRRQPRPGPFFLGHTLPGKCKVRMSYWPLTKSLHWVLQVYPQWWSCGMQNSCSLVVLIQIKPTAYTRFTRCGQFLQKTTCHPIFLLKFSPKCLCLWEGSRKEKARILREACVLEFYVLRYQIDEVGVRLGVLKTQVSFLLHCWSPFSITMSTSFPIFYLVCVRVVAPVRNCAIKLRAEGIFQGARVCRGADWEYGDEDGGEKAVGTVQEICDAAPDSVVGAWMPCFYLHTLITVDQEEFFVQKFRYFARRTESWKFLD